MNKRELLYEIDKFDEALQIHKYTEELIPADKYYPYKLDDFASITFDYLDDLLNDSEVYLYLKEKYNKTERENGIVNE